MIEWMDIVAVESLGFFLDEAGGIIGLYIEDGKYVIYDNGQLVEDFDDEDKAVTAFERLCDSMEAAATEC
jgi:hypothetical protein